MYKKIFILFLLIKITLTAQENISPWNLKELYQAPKWEKTDKAPKSGMTGLLYDSIHYKGKKVQVFAYYSTPKGKAPDGGWPAVVCVHGGGGTAFDTWVKKWNEHGYAAISMDLEGHYPISKDKKNRKAGRVSTENPGPVRVGVFGDYALPIEEQWYYHAVSQIILAHSLIRSFPEVNPDKTGITGVSWGGNLTSTTIGVDNRFKFAIPGYGCGFLIGSSGHQGRAIKKGPHWDTVAKYYDGSAYFKNVTYPTLWVNGTNDYHFDMPATQKSANAINGPATIRFQLRMGHGHGAVWNTKECYTFADSIIKGKAPLLKIHKPELQANTLTVEAIGKISKAELLYTKGTEKVWPDREWVAAPASFKDQKISSKIPEGTTAVFFNITDTNGMMVSSEFIEVK